MSEICLITNGGSAAVVTFALRTCQFGDNLYAPRAVAWYGGCAASTDRKDGVLAYLTLHREDIDRIKEVQRMANEHKLDEVHLFSMKHACFSWASETNISDEKGDVDPRTLTSFEICVGAEDIWLIANGETTNGLLREFRWKIDTGLAQLDPYNIPERTTTTTATFNV